MENFEQNTTQPSSMNTEGTSSEMPTPEIREKDSSVATVLVSIVIIVLLIVSVFFVLSMQSKNATMMDESQTAAEPTESVSPNDDLNSIESEANETTIDSSTNLDYNFDTEN